MKTYITLLRGINVSGKNSLKMDDLKYLCTQIGLTNVATYIQSGNIIFTSDLDLEIINTKIQESILTQFGFEIPAITILLNQFEDILNQNPFNEPAELSQLYITYLHSTPDIVLFEQIEKKKAGEEKIQLKNSVVYINVPNGYGKTKLTNALIESKLKMTATTRNWRTSLKILEIAHKIAQL